MSTHRRRDGSASRPIRRTNIHQAREGCRRVEGHIHTCGAIAVWVGSFSVCAHLDLAIEAMYCHDDAGGKPFGGTEGYCKMLNNHKEEGERRRKMDGTDRYTIAVELQKHSHPLDVK